MAWTIAEAGDRDITVLEVDRVAESAWVDQVVARGSQAIQRSSTCTPGYYNNEGHPDARTVQGSFFFGGPTEYAELLEAWRADGTLAGLVCRSSG